MPPPPGEPADLLAWAEVHGVEGHLDDVIIGTPGMWGSGTALPGRGDERLTYRQILIAQRREDGRPLAYDAGDTARRFLHRIAQLAATAHREREWMDAHGRDPEDDALTGFLARLRQDLRQLTAAAAPGTLPRPPGTFEPGRARVTRDPVPMLRYDETTLTGQGGMWGGPDDLALMLLGWEEEPSRWECRRGERAIPDGVPSDRLSSALEAAIDLVRDPRRVGEQEPLAELLRLPAWRYALGTLDEHLTRIEAEKDQPLPNQSTNYPGERLGFRVRVDDQGSFHIDPVVQKQSRTGALSKGSVLQWHQMGNRAGLTLIDRRAYLAYDDRFARNDENWSNRPLTPAQVHGILLALVDHPAVYLDGPGGASSARRNASEQARLEIRPGRLRLLFVTAGDGSLSPRFELVGFSLLPSEAAASVMGPRHLVHLHRPTGQPPLVLLAELSPQAAALVQSLALAPARFPPEAHDALATRLETLQEAVDIEFPSRWTHTISPADGRTIARLELLASGALHARFVVRPVPLGPTFTPGDGPSLVLEGQGRSRHGARRDLLAEKQAALTLRDQLALDRAGETEPWCWRVSPGDAALHLVATLKDLVDGGRAPVLAAPVLVEWADDQRLLALGSVSRSDMHLKVADKRDWFAVEGRAQVAGQAITLSDLLTAIREGRRYVPVGPRGFVRIEENLRAALSRADDAMFESRGVLQVSGAAIEVVAGIVDRDAQLEATAAFLTLRRRMKEGEGATARVSPALDTTLRPYQRAGVAWMARLAHWGAGALLADEMGLGKTVQALALLSHRSATGPAIVVAPTSVVANWVSEAARFTPELSVRLYRGADRHALLDGLGPGDLVVTSFAIAVLDADALARVSFGTLVVDEAQALKNAATERAKALGRLTAGWRLGLTGTPIENHVGEIWSLLRVIAPGLLGGWEHFRARYAVPIEKFGDDRRRQALAALLRPFVLRRTKAEVARELPARTEVVRSVRLSADERSLYEELRQATLDELAKTKADRKREGRDGRELRFVLLAALTRLRQLCCHPRLVYPRTHAGSAKAAFLIDMLGELRDGGHKALVFSQFRRFLDLIGPRLDQHGFRVLVLDGTTPVEQRERRIAAFQAGEADVFLISLKAGGFGLNLTAADTVIHLDPWWNPAVEDQATARAHRIGQRYPVTAVRLVARDTIEEAVLALHASKRALAAGVLEDTDVAASLGTDELIDLIRMSSPSRSA